METVTQDFSQMSISQIAQVIRKDWSKQGKGVNYAAKPYLEAMDCLQTVNDRYIMDDGKGIVRYFLCNANTWKGETAKAVKKELNKRVK